MDRRRFIRGLGLFAAGPAIVRVASIMPISGETVFKGRGVVMLPPRFSMSPFDKAWPEITRWWGHEFSKDKDWLEELTTEINSGEVAMLLASALHEIRRS